MHSAARPNSLAVDSNRFCAGEGRVSFFSNLLSLLFISALRLFCSSFTISCRDFTLSSLLRSCSTCCSSSATCLIVLATLSGILHVLANEYRTLTRELVVQGAFSGKRWTAFKNFLASRYSLGCFPCACVSTAPALLVRTLLGSPADGKATGCTGRVEATDEALFSPCAFAAVAGIALFQVDVWTGFFVWWDESMCVLENNEDE